MEAGVLDGTGWADCHAVDPLVDRGAGMIDGSQSAAAGVPPLPPPPQIQYHITATALPKSHGPTI